ncbi:hypothetical protein D9M72_547990 [compost metagenome]
MDQAGVVGANPVAAIGVHRCTVGSAFVPVHVNEHAAVGRGAGFGVVVEGPDLLDLRMGVGQVHRAPVRAEAQAVGHDEPTQPGIERPALSGAVAVQRAVGGVGAHVQHHAAGPEASLTIAAAVVQAHIGAGMVDVGQGFTVEAAVVARMQTEEPAFHAGDPAAVGMRRDASEHLRGFPGSHLPGVGTPAL